MKFQEVNFAIRRVSVSTFKLEDYFGFEKNTVTEEESSLTLVVQVLEYLNDNSQGLDITKPSLVCTSRVFIFFCGVNFDA